MPFPNKKTQFKKGKSGNPKGRPKKPDLKEALAKVLSEKDNKEDAVERVIRSLLKKALKGDVNASKLLLETAYGKAQARIDITTNGEKVAPPIAWISGEDDDEETE